MQQAHEPVHAHRARPARGPAQIEAGVGLRGEVEDEARALKLEAGQRSCGGLVQTHRPHELAKLMRREGVHDRGLLHR